MLGGGIALAGGGVALLSYNINHGDNLSLFGPFVSLIGISSIIDSIPKYFVSRRTKKKAVSITVSTEQFMSPVKSGWTYQYQPAVSIKIPLGSH